MQDNLIPSLHELARDNNVEGMMKLLIRRENVNAVDKYHRTPLHLASFSGSLEAARVLIEYGADVNAVAMDNIRPLGFAVIKSHLEIARLLLSNGATSEINSLFQKQGVTCLHIASKNGNSDMVRLLLEKGSNPSIKSKAKKLAIDDAMDDETKNIISESMNKRNEDKKKKVIEYHKNRKERKENEIEEVGIDDSIKNVTSLKRESESETPEHQSKKLDVKKLSFMLDDDEYMCFLTYTST